MPLKNSSISLIITSPPYLTRVDYIKPVLGEIHVIGNQESFWRETLRKKMMGTVKMRSEKENSIFGNYVLTLLEKLKNHKSKGSENYYLSFHQQYFSDLNKVLKENFRVLQSGGISYWVIQNSFYKEIEIDLYEVMSEMIDNIGYSSHEIVYNHHFSNFIGKSNPNQRRWKVDKKITEYVVKFIK